MEEALYETTILRQFAGLSLEHIPDEATIFNVRRLLEKHAGILTMPRWWQPSCLLFP
ncbi:hypothetical protein N878_04270 [Pseudomonas sp. EGD-AK9]|nr:hypothetical protein N878_04270 [Pseudomonas sp. EGD-AK9]